ncbi:MAG: hypothetical protein HOH73_06475 [Alphaproteobacteria bacterium]|jgi:lipopolysaccharide export system protein LptA|nr:hypothetical protein [Alphaproteobacteria bacterium]
MNAVKSLNRKARITKVIVIILIVIFLLPVLNYFKSSLPGDSIYSFEENIGVTNSNYTFYNNKSTKFNLLSSKAILEPNDIIKFLDVKLFHEIEGRNISLLALDAFYNQSEERINFANGLFVKDNMEMDIYTSKAEYYFKNNILFGRDNIIFKNKFSSLTSESFKIDFTKYNYLFYNNVNFSFKDNVRKAELYGGSLEINDINNLITVIEEPIYYEEELNINADKIILKYKEVLNKIELTELQASNNVVIKHISTTLLGNEAIFYPDRNILVLENEVKITRAKNTIKGEKIIYNLNDGVIKILKVKDQKLDLDFQ